MIEPNACKPSYYFLPHPPSPFLYWISDSYLCSYRVSTPPLITTLNQHPTNTLIIYPSYPSNRPSIYIPPPIHLDSTIRFVRRSFIASCTSLLVLIAISSLYTCTISHT